MSMAMVLQQTSEARSPSLKKFKDTLTAIITDKHQPILAKSGAIMASGILDAGGGNVVISMQSRAGFMKIGGAVGMMMFLQHWYWYPLLPFLSLAFTPTMLIGLNKDFNMPTSFEVTCNAPPSMFAYPKIEEKKEDEKKLVATAVLSTTARAKAREARKEAKKLGRQPSLDSELAPIPLERVHSHLSTTSYISIDAVSLYNSSFFLYAKCCNYCYCTGKAGGRGQAKEGQRAQFLPSQQSKSLDPHTNPLCQYQQ